MDQDFLLIILLVFRYGVYACCLVHVAYLIRIGSIITWVSILFCLFFMEEMASHSCTTHSLITWFINP